MDTDQGAPDSIETFEQDQHQAFDWKWLGEEQRVD
jgi:hypothetical protein